MKAYDRHYTPPAPVVEPVYYVRCVIEGHELPIVECVAVDRETALVGRNILNRFILNLDGKRLRFQLNV